MRRSLFIKIPTLVSAVAAFVWLDGALAVAVASAILLAGIGILLALVLHPNASAWTPTLWRAPRHTRSVALTFDDGPDPASTLEIARILGERNVRAAFFVVGERARKHPEIVARLSEEGHLICNHTDSHSMTFHFQLWGKARQELRACNATIREVIGKEPRLFRSPQGLKNPALGDVLNETGMTAIGWQVRGLDSVRGNADAIERRIVEGARPGGVIMLHDGGGLGGSEDRSATIAALPRIIDRLRERGLTVARLDELLELEPYRSA